MLIPSSSKIRLYLIKISVFLLALFFCTAKIYAGEKTSFWPNVLFKDTLEGHETALGITRDIFQDRFGFIWVAGESGLARYDGNQFTHYQHEPDNPNSLSNSLLWRLMGDSKGRLWIAGNGGISQYDYENDIFINYEQDNEISPGNNVFSLLEDSKGRVWAGLIDGTLALFNPDTGAFKYFRYQPEDNTNGESNLIFNIFEDENGDLWLSSLGSGLIKFNPENVTFTPYKFPVNDEHDVKQNTVRTVVQDLQGRWWIGTDAGLNLFDSSSNTYSHYEAVNYLGKPMPRYPVWDILVDPAGKLWLATDGGGIILVDPASGTQPARWKAEDGRGTLPAKVIRCLLMDKIGDIWAGSLPRGIYLFDRSAPGIAIFRQQKDNPKSLNHSTVLSIYEDKNREIWLGTEAGLNYFERKAGVFHHYEYKPDDPNSLSAKAILSIVQDKDGDLWLGTWGGGLNRLNPETGKIKRYEYDENNPNSLKGLNVWESYRDSNDTLWFGMLGKGLARYVPEADNFVYYRSEKDDPTSLSTDLVWSIYEDSQNNLWIGTTVGINLFNRETQTFTRYVGALSNPDIFDILEDSQGRFWVGTRVGIGLMDREKGTFTYYGKKDGLNNEVVNGILEDDYGMLWLSTDTGLSQFNPETKTFKNYNRTNWLTGGFKIGSALKTRDGTLYFGGNKGFTFFKSKNVKTNTHAPSIVLTDFQIFNKPVDIGGHNSPLSKSISLAENIQLDYHQSMFSFEFAALSYRGPDKNQYAYKLEGFDKEWNFIGQKHEATYTNLNPGKYTFMVKGSNDEGFWNEEGAKVDIKILPPPWKTWWAYVIYALGILAIIIRFIRSQQLKRLAVEEQNRILELRVAERTNELAKKNSDIQAMLSNIPQGLFTIQVDGSIHSEYSAFLEIIFDRQDITNKNFAEFLFSKALSSKDEIDSTEAAVFSMLGEDDLNYEFNKHLLMHEYEFGLENERKTLTLDWSPIFEHGEIIKLMVSVRDVTQLRQVEKEALVQKRQLTIIGQLLNISAEKLENFISSTREFIRTNRSLITNVGNNETMSHSSADILLRNMHTIKGNSRTLGFSYLSQVAHDVESNYCQLKEQKFKCWEPEFLIKDLTFLEDTLREYLNIYRDTLGREETSSRRINGKWLSNQTLDELQKYAGLSQYESLQWFFNTLRSKSLKCVLEDIISSLPSIAKDLGKEPPKVILQSEKVRVRENAANLIVDTFTHVLRNSMDHGLESTHERRAKGKHIQGTINIYTEVHSNAVSICIKDDGRGLDMYSLRKKGETLELWQSNSDIENAEIAQLLFHSGVSTAQKVSDISGRGVGMSAVKQMLMEKGGDATLILHQPQRTKDEFIPFELVITLPIEMFVVMESDHYQSKKSKAD